MCAAACGDVSAFESGCRGEQLDRYIYFAEIAGASLRHPCRSQFMCALIITFLDR